MQHCLVEEPVICQEFRISKNGGSHGSPWFVVFFMAGATVSNFTILNFTSPPITSSNEVFKVLARAAVAF